MDDVRTLEAIEPKPRLRLRFALYTGLVLLGTGLAISWLVNREVENRAARTVENQARAVAVGNLRRELRASDFAGPVTAARRKALDALFRRNIVVPGVVGGGLVSPGGTVTYSARHERIGRPVRHPKILDAVLRGEVTRRVTYTDTWRGPEAPEGSADPGSRPRDLQRQADRHHRPRPGLPRRRRRNRRRAPAPGADPRDRAARAVHRAAADHEPAHTTARGAQPAATRARRGTRPAARCRARGSYGIRGRPATPLRAERPAPRARPAQGRVRLARLARAAHAADLDPRLHRAAPRGPRAVRDRAPALPRGRRAELAASARARERPALPRPGRGGQARDRAQARRSRPGRRRVRRGLRAGRGLEGDRAGRTRRRRPEARGRSRPARADARQPRLERAQVHAERRPGRRSPERGRRDGAPRGRGHRARHPAGGAGPAVRALLPQLDGRRERDPGNGPRPHDHEGDRRTARRAHRDREPGERGHRRSRALAARRGAPRKAGRELAADGYAAGSGSRTRASSRSATRPRPAAPSLRRR